MVATAAVLTAGPALESVALNLVIRKLIPTFMGYASDSKLNDESVVREYMRTLGGNSRNSLSSLRDSLRAAQRMDDWKALDGPLVKIDEFDSGLRASLTGDAAMALKNIDPISKKHLESLMAQDIRIIEVCKEIEATCQGLLESGHAIDSSTLTESAHAISAKLNSAIAMFKERRVIINGLPLSMVTGESKISSSKVKMLVGVGLIAAIVIGVAWKNGMM